MELALVVAGGWMVGSVLVGLVGNRGGRRGQVTLHTRARMQLVRRQVRRIPGGFVVEAV